MATDLCAGTLHSCRSTTTLHVVVVAASAGGPEALKVILRALPETFRLPVLIVQHRSAQSPPLLARVLGWSSTLPVREARPGDTLHPQTVYVAPPDFHMSLSADHTLALSREARVHYVRPAADILFASAAQVFRDGVVAVVLTGNGVDGARGVRAVKEAGGLAIAQDESTSAYFSMPRAAIRTGLVDLVLPLERIGGALSQLDLTGTYP
ncbi:MAG TPA: chemotaxis protein CheB [Gemmatimonadaceae bacterium]|jgi:two-component system chemotaxis response regulator CheB|nr:chemotaxis protein CheB [Gemmatimonadaceae bacterium]